MGSDTTLEIDSEGLPLFRRNPANPSAEAIDVATALKLERQALLREDLELCGIQKGGKEVRSLKPMAA